MALTVARAVTASRSRTHHSWRAMTRNASSRLLKALDGVPDAVGIAA
jgi:hypothetical protein